jgi:hypothetical protein
MIGGSLPHQRSFCQIEGGSSFVDTEQYYIVPAPGPFARFYSDEAPKLLLKNSITTWRLKNSCLAQAPVATGVICDISQEAEKFVGGLVHICAISKGAIVLFFFSLLQGWVHEG